MAPIRRYTPWHAEESAVRFVASRGMLSLVPWRTCVLAILSLLVALLAMLPPAAAAGVPGTGFWRRTGGMSTPRFWHTATRLANGKVLVAGGSAGGDGWLASAEVYNPATGTWASAGTMRLGRVEHTATPLPNGTVLVVGGMVGGRSWYTDSTEIYDPGLNGWQVAPGMSSARSSHSATLLADGRVLVSGGGWFDAAGMNHRVLATAEVYDPVARVWSATGSMITPREMHTTTLLDDGRVLATGGRSNGPDLASAEIYDPVSGAWTATATMATVRTRHTATRMANGRVLVIGAEQPGNGCPYSKVAEMYDPDRGTWSVTTSSCRQFLGHTATLLPDGRVLTTGGADDPNTQLEIPPPPEDMFAQLFDSGGTMVGFTAPMAVGRAFHTATLLVDGNVLVTGGGGSQGVQASAELFTPLTPDLAVFVTDTPDPVATGTTLSYSITVINNATTAARGVTVVDTAPPGMTLAPSDPGTVVCSGTTQVTCTLGDLAAGEQRTFVLSGTVPIHGSVTNKVTVRSDDVDPNSRNNSVTIRSVARPDVVPPTTSMTVSPAPNAAGWNNTPVTVGLTASDNGGIGVRQLMFHAGRAQVVPAAIVDGSVGSLALGDDGYTVVTAFAIDKSGNLEGAKAQAVRIDRTPPTSVAPVAQLYVTTLGATTVPVKVSWSAFDACCTHVVSHMAGQSTNGGAFAGIKLPSSPPTILTRHLTMGSTYQFRASAIDLADNVGTWAVAPSFVVDDYQEENVAIAYSGPTATAWTTAPLGEALGGSVRYASAAGARATVTFTGSSIAFVTAKGPNRGRAELWLDGKKVKTLDLYASTLTVRRAMYVKNGLADGAHRLEVRVLGAASSPPSSGTRVDIDGFIVLR